MIKKIDKIAALILSGIFTFANSSTVYGLEAAEASDAFINTTSINLPQTALFSPPEGWHLADSASLPKSVKIMVVGKGDYDFPPSINLGTEVYNGTLKEYLDTVKAINESQGAKWKNLGSIRTQAGNANLSQVDAKTEWGEVRMMHVILLQDGMIYILTAAAVKDEFPKFYKDFFNAMRSLRFNKDVFDAITDVQAKNKLEMAVAHLKTGWMAAKNNLLESSQETKNDEPLTFEQIFKSDFFQNNYWIPFKNILKNDYAVFGASFEELILQHAQNELHN